MWLLQKNLPAIVVVVVVYAKQIMALGREKNTVHSSHSFHPLTLNARGDHSKTPRPVMFSLTFCSLF